MTSNSVIRDQCSATDPEWTEEQIISSLNHLREIHAQVNRQNLSSTKGDANRRN